MNWKQCYDLLLQGDYDNGWPDHEIIVTDNPERGTYHSSNYGKPIWDGTKEPITLLVNAEFGDGDTIQFYRFVREVKQRVSKVILRCNEDFVDLFSDVTVVGKDEILPDFDKVIHMMALPKILGMKKDQISGKPYLIPNPNVNPHTATQCMSVLKFFKAGVCWAGNPFNKRDHIRSVPVELFDQLKIVPGLRFFSLNNLYKPPEDYFDVRSLMKNWNETAHLVRLMDLVITVDTAIAHLAGSMGKPVWLLVSDEQPDWRWGTHGDKTIWYDSVTLFRRKNSWETAFQELKTSFTKHLEYLKAKEPTGLVCKASAVVETVFA